MKTQNRKSGMGWLMGILTKAFRRSPAPPPKGGCSQCGSAGHHEGEELQHAACGKEAEARPITKAEQKWIMERIDELFDMGKVQGGEKPVEAGPITDEDERLIMEHVEELFVVGGQSAQAEPITEEDQRFIMEHIQEIFEIGREQSGGMAC